MKCYIVGGAVRDILMGQKPKDADMAFSGSIEDFLLAYPQAQQVGKSIQVWIVQGREYMPLYNNCIQDDLRNRDLTINAFAMDDDGHIFAHPQAFFDLKNAVLRPASTYAFEQDPSRIYRLARFAANFPLFTVHKEALKQAQAVVQAKKQCTLPAERVGRELFKALQAPCPSRFFQILQATQAFNPWFAELHVHFEQYPESMTQWGHFMDSCQHKDFSAYELALYRWMLLGGLWSCASKSKLYSNEEHPLSALGIRLCLPLAFTKAALCIVELAPHASSLTTLCFEKQASMILAIHKMGLSKLFWAAIDRLCLEKSSLPPISSHAFKVLKILMQIHLPLEWQNLGAESGEKLRQLQVQALENFFKS